MKARHLLGVTSGMFLIAALACVFMALRPPNDGVRIPVYAANGKMGYIDSSGKMVITAKFDEASPFGPDGQAQVSVEVNVSSIEKFFRRWSPFRWRISMAGQSYYKIDRSGNKVPDLPGGAESHLSGTLPDSDEMLLQERGAESQWILKYGSGAFPKALHKTVVDYKGDDPAAVLVNDRWGFINRRGENVIPYQWDETLGFDGSGRACVAVDGKWGVIDREGRLIVPLYFKSLSGFDAKNMCAARLASGWGFIDANGKIEIPFRYQHAGSFDRFDMAKITISDTPGNARCGWINRRGEFVVQPLYQVVAPAWAKNFKDHELLPVIGPSGHGLIDRKGRSVVAAAPEKLETIEDPAAPSRFWIRTVPSPLAMPSTGPARSPFKPVCYDQTGKVIWSNGIFASPSSFLIYATICGLIAAVLFVIERLWHRAKSANVG
jgi:hypothetical protein